MSGHQPMSPDAPVLDPLIQHMLGELIAEGGAIVYKLTPSAARDSLLRIQSRVAPVPEARMREVKVEFTGRELRLHVVYPPNATSHCPGVMYFHGGGWVLGDVTTHDRIVGELAVGVNAAIVFVDYDRAPEHRYPVAVEQAYAVLQ